MQSLALYKITEDLSALLDGGIDEDGVISEELGAMLARFEDKGKAVTAYILNQDATATAIDDTIKNLEKRAMAFRKRSESLRSYLQVNMKRAGISQISADDGTFTAKLYLERDSSIEVFDEKQVPKAYMRTPDPKPVVAVPDKKAIAAAIKAGTEVPGAKIVKSDRLTIS